MKTTFKFTLQTTWKICFFILTAFSLLIALFLAYYSTFFSYYSATDGSPIYMIQDSAKTNFLTFGGAVAVTILLDYFLKKFPKYQELVSLLFLAVCCVLFLIAGCLWTIELPYYPTGDQINTTAAAKYFLEGNYSMLQKGGYVGIYPQQKGLILLYEILFTLFGPYCYHVVEKMHVISGVIVMIFGFLFLRDISNKCVYRLLYCCCILFCAPYLILMPYAYGDIPSIAFCVVMFWALQRYSRDLQKRYVVVAVFMAILALFTRQNSWIVLIAVAIGLGLLALEKRSICPLIAAFCIILLSALSVKAVNISYEIRSGYEDTIGTPASLYFAMGMQESPGGPGTYNRFNQGTYESVNFDREAASELGWIEVENRLEFFKENPQTAVTFFKTKAQLQWLEPLFETLISTDSFPEDAELPQWIHELYYGKYHDRLFLFANGYQSIAYLSFCVYVLSLLMKIVQKKAPINSIQLIPLIAIVGGFLFSIIWEAQCRYVLPYYLFMLVYVPIGLGNVGEWIIQFIKWLLTKSGFNRRKTSAHHSQQNESSAA